MSTLRSITKLQAQTSYPPLKAPKDVKKEAAALLLKAALDDEPVDTIELRDTPLEERAVAKIRGPLLTTARVALPLVGAALLGPVGLGIGAVLRTGISMVEQTEGSLGKKARNAVTHGLFAAAVGSVGLIPGVLGLGASALALKFLSNASEKLDKRDDPYTIKFETFAKSYVPKVEAKLNRKIETKAATENDVSSPALKEKLAAQSIMSATKLCCEQLSPAVAVTIAREVAKELIPAGSAQEDIFELLLTKDKSVPLTQILHEKPSDSEATDKILLSSFKSPSPAAATTQHVLLNPGFLEKHSPEALTVTTGHELSHVAHRDVVGNMGDKTLETAIQAAGDQEFSLSHWRDSDSTLKQVELASAELSREREFRCDKEGAEFALDEGVTPEQVSKGLRDVLGTDNGKLDLEADHPLNADRFAAIDRLVKPKSELKLREFPPA